jgi:hypothetical protein
LIVKHGAHPYRTSHDKSKDSLLSFHGPISKQSAEQKSGTETTLIEKLRKKKKTTLPLTLSSRRMKQQTTAMASEFLPLESLATLGNTATRSKQGTWKMIDG